MCFTDQADVECFGWNENIFIRVTSGPLWTEKRSSPEWRRWRTGGRCRRCPRWCRPAGGRWRPSSADRRRAHTRAAPTARRQFPDSRRCRRPWTEKYRSRSTAPRLKEILGLWDSKPCLKSLSISLIWEEFDSSNKVNRKIVALVSIQVYKLVFTNVWAQAWKSFIVLGPGFKTWEVFIKKSHRGRGVMGAADLLPVYWVISLL